MNKKTLVIALSLFTTSLFSYAEKQINTSLNFKKDERVTLTLIDRKEGGVNAENAFLQGTVNLIQPNQLRPIQLMPVVKTLLGESKAEVFGIYAWSNAKALKDLRSHPTYQKEVLPLQKQAWNEITYSDVNIKEDFSFSLSKDKFYTVAELWLKDEAIYEAYIQATTPLRDTLGARIVFKLKPDSYSSLYQGKVAPNYVVLVEWDAEESINKYPEHKIFKDAYAMFQASVNRLDWHQVELMTDSYK